MLSKLKRILFGDHNTIQEESVLPPDEIQELGITKGKKKATETNKPLQTLSLHPEWEEQIDQEKKYLLNFTQSSLPDLELGQVAIRGFNLIIGERNEIIISAFIRNGLDRSIQFEDMPLLLLDDQEKAVVRQVFSLSEVGEIPPFSDRPWMFVFHPESVIIERFSLKDWKIAFEIQKKKTPAAVSLQLITNPSWGISPVQKQQLETLLQQFPPIHEGEFNVSGVEAFCDESGQLHVFILLRNGTKQTLKLEQIPLVVEDVRGDEVASGLFKVDLEIPSLSCVPWKFIFPKELMQKPTADLSKWAIKMPS